MDGAFAFFDEFLVRYFESTIHFLFKFLSKIFLLARIHIDFMQLHLNILTNLKKYLVQIISIITLKVYCCKIILMISYFPLFQVVIVGNGAVGKSSMIQRYCKGIFTRNYKKTIGVDFLEKQLR